MEQICTENNYITNGEISFTYTHVKIKRTLKHLETFHHQCLDLTKLTSQGHLFQNNNTTFSRSVVLEEQHINHYGQISTSIWLFLGSCNE